MCKSASQRGILEIANAEEQSLEKAQSPAVLQSLQCWRAYGAFAVLLFHINCSLIEIYHIDSFKTTLGHGGSGVDVFFVLSGFVIYLSTAKGSKLSTYLFKRFSRIYPIYWLTVIPLFTMSLAMKNQQPHDPASLLGSCLLLFGHESYNGVSWTLSYEVYFYLLFAGAVLHRAFGYVLVALGVLIAGLAITGVTPPGPRILALMLDPIVLEFLAGIVAARIYELRLISSRKFAAFLFVTGLGYYLWSGALDLPRVAGFGVASFLLVLSSSALESQRKLSNGPLLRILCSLGEASYVLYLIHLPIVRVVLKGMAPYLRGSVVGLSLTCCLLCLAICLLSIFVHRFVELPLLRQIRRLHNWRTSASKNNPVLQSASG